MGELGMLELATDGVATVPEGAVSEETLMKA